jgi:hypothetical protein
VPGEKSKDLLEIKLVWGGGDIIQMMRSVKGWLKGNIRKLYNQNRKPL